MNTIETLEKTTIYGNAYSDRQILADLDAFIQSENVVPEKIRAVQMLDKVMGLDIEQITAKDVEDYIVNS